MGKVEDGSRTKNAESGGRRDGSPVIRVQPRIMVMNLGKVSMRFICKVWRCTQPCRPVGDRIGKREREQRLCGRLVRRSFSVVSRGLR
jgi:hypothetical protein